MNGLLKSMIHYVINKDNIAIKTHNNISNGQVENV